MALMDHPLWSELLPYVRIEIYGRDGGPKHPRHRIEVEELPQPLRLKALACEVPCISCGHSIHPIRQRQVTRRGIRQTHRGALYYANSCPLEVRVGCSRGDASRDDYQRVKRAVDGSGGGTPPQAPPVLPWEV
jgi:hypothetical protein